jgi:electron transfer flavoprotein alpha subunit
VAKIAVIKRKCTGCGECAAVCPFSAIDMAEGKADINQGCKTCGLCLKACPFGAIVKLETRTVSVDKDAWQGFLIFAEQTDTGLHPVTRELIGKAHALTKGSRHKVSALLIGSGCTEQAEELRHYGLDRVLVYDDPQLAYFRADTFAACFEDAIRHLRPSAVLVGATALGRSLAPRVSTRFQTGLTADCTALELRGNSDLVQIRPAFGGNIMAQIVTPYTRPQFATVRYKVMEAWPRQQELSGKVIQCPLPKGAGESKVRLVETRGIPKAANISDAEILVVGGRGLHKESDLVMIRELAALLGGEYALSRPLVERGWGNNARQIGLSGRTVRPKLIITCGVSGAIQFTACMNAAERIVAINSDPAAPIFQMAHVGIVGDLYEVVPRLIQKIKAGGEKNAAV